MAKPRFTPIEKQDNHRYTSQSCGQHMFLLIHREFVLAKN